MAATLKALQQLQKKGWFANEPSWPDARRYIETGDAQALKRIKPPGKNSYNLWIWEIMNALPPVDRMEEDDLRGLHVLVATERYDRIGYWLSKVLPQEQPDADWHARFRDELLKLGLKEVTIAAMTAVHVATLVTDERPNSAGRYLLALSETELQAALKRAFALGFFFQGVALVELLLDFAPERLLSIIDPLITNNAPQPASPKYVSEEIAERLLKKDPVRHEAHLAAKFRFLKPDICKFAVAEVLTAYDREKYGPESLEVARALLSHPEECQARFGIWMLENFGSEVLPDISAYLANEKEEEWRRKSVLDEAVKRLGLDAIPAALATLVGREITDLRIAALGHLVALDDGTHASRIQSELESGLKATKAEVVAATLKLVAKWHPDRFEERTWSLLSHKSKPVRSLAARVLAKLGDAAVDRAGKLLEDRKADTRAAAVMLLSAVNTPGALEALEARLDLEANDDVRDAMLLALDAARSARGDTLSRSDIDARVARTAAKLQGPPAPWIDEAALPPLHDREGRPFDTSTVRYLLYRQSRAREIQPDIEAKPLLELVDRKTSGDLALDILRRFATSKAAPDDRWALTIAGLLGDDRVVPPLNSLVHQWAESNRGKMAEFAVQALALLGTETALTTIDALSIRYRTKNKNIGQAAVDAFTAAAERQGVSPDELGDRVVPWLGFSPNEPRVIDCGGRRIEVSIGDDFKLRFLDLEKNKPVSSLPKSAPMEVLDAFKGLAATLREVVKAQVLRLENLMVRQYRWAEPRWAELFLVHPLLRPFAHRLVWSAYDESGELAGTFRSLEDRSLTGPNDDEFVLKSAWSVGIAHPLELTDDVRNAWCTHLADYEIEPPFPQLERPVVRVGSEHRESKISRQFEGTSLNALTFKGRAERLGWTRGSVADGGSVISYGKSFPIAGTEAFLGIDGLYMGIGMNEEVTLGALAFVPAGSLQVGSYIYDSPLDGEDPRRLPFGSVPPIVYSEVMGDLGKIAGKSEVVDEE